MEEMFPAIKIICIVGMIYGVIMAGIWTCILIMSIKYGSIYERFKPLPPPKVQSFEEFLKDKD